MATRRSVGNPMGEDIRVSESITVDEPRRIGRRAGLPRSYSPVQDYYDTTGGGEFQGWRGQEDIIPYKDNWQNYPADEFDIGLPRSGAIGAQEAPRRDYRGIIGLLGAGAGGFGAAEEKLEEYLERVAEEKLEARRQNLIDILFSVDPYSPYEVQRRYDKAQMLMNEPEARAMEEDVALDFMDGGYDFPIVDIGRTSPWLSEAYGISPGFDNARTYSGPGDWGYSVIPETYNIEELFF
jgi:hypothetical protein